MAGEKNENGGAFPYMKPPKRSGWEECCLLLYNKSDHTVLGRTGKGWALLLLFYVIFYLVLAALWAICLQGLFASLDDKEPTYVLERSLIGTNPGMGFRPISNITEEGSLIWYNSTNATQVRKWVNLMNVFMMPYIISAPGSNQVPCNFDKGPEPNKVCAVETDSFGHCSAANDYGFNTSSPCVFLKLNRIFDWVPEYYNDTSNLPEEMPPDLVEDIKKEYKKSPKRANQIWVSCQGEHPADRELLLHQFEYFPHRGFPSYYYPFRNDPGYLSPLVAVKITRPNTPVAANIECRAWAKNIKYRGGNRDRQGSVHFEILLDN